MPYFQSDVFKLEFLTDREEEEEVVFPDDEPNEVIDANDD
ncbi:unnamed protein product [Larinioides sclopetarius]|uniref:Uncharacterized protein n=1 Tax=Larinioides sclopetarius TaxID=280406 RepID=A0AAV2AWF5_9ARAC